MLVENDLIWAQFLRGVRTDRQRWRDRCQALAAERLSWETRIADLSAAYAETVPGPSAASSGVVPKHTGTSGRRLRILLNGHDLKFTGPFVQWASADSRYEIRVDKWHGHEAHDERRSLELLEWADVVYCEWCLGSAAWYSSRRRPGQRLFIRLHHQEMELHYRREIAWENVDAIVFTNFRHYRVFEIEQPECIGKAVVIFVAIDCDGFDVAKLPGAEFNLGLVGINPLRKRPDLTVQILDRLRRVDRRYALYFKSRMPWEYWWLWERTRERNYFTKFFQKFENSPNRNAIGFDPHGPDMSSWFAKIGFLLSTSDHEGSHQSVAEAMAAGSLPVIRHWDGATPLYPAEYVFEEPEQAVEIILRLRKGDAYERCVQEAKAYARQHFDATVINSQFDALIQGSNLRGPAFPAMQMIPLYGKPRDLRFTP